MLPNPTERFTGRVESYKLYRPGYPPEIVPMLRHECCLTDDSPIVDVAAGTGLLTELFLDAGFPVTAVEPNTEMRTACSELRQRYPRLRLVDGTAESTHLPSASADLITVAQAMHWLDLERTRVEFSRLLRRGGFCAVLYNNRRMGGDPFHDAYERLLLDFGIDYGQVRLQHVAEDRLRAFFAPAQMRRAIFPNSQTFGLEGLMGRVLSSSYMPQPGQPGFDAMRQCVERIFDENQRDGQVTMKYECEVNFGQLS